MRFLKFAFISTVVAIFLISTSYSVFNNFSKTKSTVLCGQDGHNIQILDKAVTQQEFSSIESVSDPSFRFFITSVKEHLLSEFEKSLSQGQISDDEVKINLVFIRLALTMPKDKSIPTLDTSKSLKFSDARLVDSPWLKISSFPKSSTLCGVFLWNERQLLIDQALMSGSTLSDVKSSIPFSGRQLDRFVRDYTKSVLLAPSPEDRSVAQNEISRRLPAEVLWLFRHAWQSTLAPFATEVDHALRTTVQMSTDGYINLSKVLIDQFFASKTTENRYESIFDLKKLIDLEAYQINELH